MMRQRYECSQCGTSYAEPKSLVRHIRTPAHAQKAGESALWYYCGNPSCSERFARKDGLARHHREVHEGLKRRAALSIWKARSVRARAKLPVHFTSHCDISQQTAKLFFTLCDFWSTDRDDLKDMINAQEQRDALCSIRHFAAFHDVGQHYLKLLRHSANIDERRVTGRDCAALCYEDLKNIASCLLAFGAGYYEQDLLKGEYGKVAMSLMCWISEDNVAPKNIKGPAHAPNKLQLRSEKPGLSCAAICVWQSGFSLLATVYHNGHNGSYDVLRFCLNLREHSTYLDMAIEKVDNAMDPHKLAHDTDSKDFIECATAHRVLRRWTDVATWHESSSDD